MAVDFVCKLFYMDLPPTQVRRFLARMHGILQSCSAIIGYDFACCNVLAVSAHVQS